MQRKCKRNEKEMPAETRSPGGLPFLQAQATTRAATKACDGSFPSHRAVIPENGRLRPVLPKPKPKSTSVPLLTFVPGRRFHLATPNQTLLASIAGCRRSPAQAIPVIQELRSHAAVYGTSSGCPSAADPQPGFHLVDSVFRRYCRGEDCRYALETGRKTSQELDVQDTA
jgi:hypothetical protein